MTFPSSPPSILGLCLSAFLTAALFPACAAPDPLIRASDYNQSCKVDGDCMPITEGPISCCALDCDSNAAITRTDSMRYEEDLRERAPSCGGVLCPAIACSPGLAVCTSGVCRVANRCGDPVNPGPCN